MAAVTPIDLDRLVVERRRGALAFRGLRVPDRLALGALAVVILLGVFGPLFEPHDPTLAAGLPYQSPDWSFPFGTDDAGRDMLSRCLSGLQVTLLSGLLIVGVGLLIGGLIGLIAGAAGGWVDSVLMRITDLFLALPAPVLAIAVVAAIGPSLAHTLVAISILWWPYYARMIRTEVRGLAARPQSRPPSSRAPAAHAGCFATCSPAPCRRRSSPPASISAARSRCWPASRSSAWVPSLRPRSWAA